MKPVFSTLVLALTMTGAAGFAAAEQVCMPTHEMKASLIDWYGERPIDETSQNSTQVWVSQQTGTWTVVKFLPDGNSCVIETGENWNGGLTGNEMLAMIQD